jgi:hypothetical protein
MGPHIFPRRISCQLLVTRLVLVGAAISRKLHRCGLADSHRQSPIIATDQTQLRMALERRTKRQTVTGSSTSLAHAKCKVMVVTTGGVAGPSKRSRIGVENYWSLFLFKCLFKFPLNVVRGLCVIMEASQRNPALFIPNLRVSSPSVENGL